MALTETRPANPSRRADQDFQHLAGLIGAGGVPNFLVHALGQDRHLATMPPRAAKELFGWPALNAALAEHRLAPPRLRLERGGDVTQGVFTSRQSRRGTVLRDLDPTVLMARLREGATLIVDAVNELSPPLRTLCEGLAREFSASCQANLYACWGVSQGFDVHWDDHDVFIVQIEGSKSWRLYGSTLAAPTRRGPEQTQQRPEEPLESRVLRPGDVLYLPRGYWHAAVGCGEPSLHITIGLTRKTGGDFLSWLSGRALSQTIVRRDLPLEADDAVLGGHLAAVMSSALAGDPGELARLYRRHVEANQVHRPALSFPFIGGETVDPRNQIVLTSGARRLSASVDDGPLLFSWRGVVFSLARELEGPLRGLMSGAPMTIAEFTAQTELSAQPGVPAFISEMVERGVFAVKVEQG